MSRVRPLAASGFALAAVFVAAADPAPKLAKTPAALTAEQREAVKSLDAEFERFGPLLAAIPDAGYKAFVQKTLDGYMARREALAVEFDSTRYDELRLGLLVDYQRVLAWLKPPAVPPPGESRSTAKTTPVAQPPEPKPLPFPADRPAGTPPADRPAPVDASFFDKNEFLAANCTGCHDADTRKGNLDLTSLGWAPGDPANVSVWVKVHDRVRAGEMPPKSKKNRPDAAEQAAFLGDLHAALAHADRAAADRFGRSVQRRLNASEYENAVRDLLHAPWLQIRGGLPDDGVADRFNKSGKALDVSHVQLSRMIGQADAAIRQAVSVQATRPPTTARRFYARDQKILIKEYQQVVMNTSPDRQNFPLLGAKTEVDVRLGKAPLTVGAADPVKRDLEAVGWLGIAFPKWDRTSIPVAGRYRLRFSGYTIWAGPNGYSGLFKGKPDAAERIRQATRWHIPNIDDISPGRRDEPVSVYAEGGGQNRRLGGFDLTPEPGVYEFEAWLGGKESVVPRATRLVQPRPTMPTNLNAQRDGAPGVAFRWLEIEGPLYDDDTTAGYRLMFGDLPLAEFADGGRRIVVDSKQPKADAERLLRGFLGKAYRRPADEADVAGLLALVTAQLDADVGFAEAMIAGYTAALVSPGFLVLQEQPGTLDDHALAARLSFFLGNSPPDDRLRELAAKNVLHEPAVLWDETERMLSDPKADRFVEAFLDYWLDLRKMEENTPSISLYNDYYLDDALVEAAVAESRLFFAELLRRNLPARTVVASDFTFLNERLALHYGVPNVAGVTMRRVTLPADSPRGGVLTQASVLKVTANGTTTSPVLRGKWINERILGTEFPPPPPVAAVEPDIRGAVTIRQQLDKHRADASCASCHATMDPPGFALENFDVFGGWRDRYRAVAPGKPPVPGFGKNGAPFEFHHGLPVDAAGELPDGRAFRDVRDFKRLLVKGEERDAVIARNLVKQFVAYATGSPVRFADRAAVERILDRAKADGYGVRRLVHEVVQSDLFRTK